MKKIVECVPNFSEGRRPEVIRAIADAIGSTEGIRILHITSDPDHNRSVITFIGPPETIAEAAFRGIAKAKQHIDLEVQRGQHPRLGATDVVPFVPVRGVTLEDCVALARLLGERVLPPDRTGSIWPMCAGANMNCSSKKSPRTPSAHPTSAPGG